MGALAPSGQYEPSVHAAQLVEPIAAWKEPGAHRTQDACPWASLYVPGAHGLGVVAPTEHSDPTGQGWHPDLSEMPVAFDHVPASHGSATVVPVGHHVPAVQTVGSTVAALGHIEPRGQGPAHVADRWNLAELDPSTPASHIEGKRPVSPSLASTCTNEPSSSGVVCHSQGWVD